MENCDFSQAIWRKSRRSGLSNCVEVATTPSIVALRDSKDPSGPVLRYPAGHWSTFLAAAKTGAFDRPV